MIELPKFTRTLAELRTPLDSWLYFLLRRPTLQVDELLGRSVEELREHAERLEREVTEKIGPA